MSPASHFFFLEKVEKNNDNKSVHSCCEETLRANFQSRFLFLVHFQELRQSKTERFFLRSHDIACNHMRSQRHCMRLHAISATSHAIACNLCNIAYNLRSHGSQELSHVQQGGLNLTNKLKFATTSTIIDRQPLCQTRHHIVRHIVSHRTTVHPLQQLVVTSIASSYRPSLCRHIVPSYCWVCHRSTGFTLYRHTVRSCCIVDCIIPSVVTSSHVIIPCQVIPSRHCTIVAAMPRKKGKELAKKTAQEGLVELI